ncbi:hypothetical protein PSYAE_24178 [Pseudomonas amygdali pv. aesculi str. 0893_23]|uniref:hypothetical protein n=1 Tax=Pseudomonas syringae group genomosp. 2 TaxID=251698 RepID=UPI0001CC3EFF|nr:MULTISPECIES: hypothetical protein [Pseudomonas syringae group genomosp. 2]EGH05000.1 hypothetical protein PSYAE_24178 [Pseudomonas amygdali pv. aesculi str. 0893_23]MCQ3013636.1 hypothetical protein [Pseudomonas savastanoi]
MPISSTDEEWDELVPENFDTTALLRAVDAVDVLREDLNDREGGGPPQLRSALYPESLSYEDGDVSES